MTKKKKQNKKSEAAVFMGSIGGRMNVKKHGVAHMRKLGRLSAKKRWGENHDNQ